MKKLVGEMSDLLNKIVKFSDDYADVKDIFLNDSTMELAEDAIGSLKFLNNSRKALSIIKFKYFLKGLNYENADKESIEKLIRYTVYIKHFVNMLHHDSGSFGRSFDALHYDLIIFHGHDVFQHLCNLPFLGLVDGIFVARL